jgi:hypothetical protein
MALPTSKAALPAVPSSGFVSKMLFKACDVLLSISVAFSFTVVLAGGALLSDAGAAAGEGAKPRDFPGPGAGPFCAGASRQTCVAAMAARRNALFFFT